MQENLADNLSTSSRLPENVTQQPYGSRTQFTKAVTNPRFAITPESMGMNVRFDPSNPNGELKSQQEPISYNEQRNKNSMAKILTDYKQESNDSFYSSHSHTENIHQAKSSSCKNQHMTQSPSPNISPQTMSQQWNFELGIDNKCAELMKSTACEPHGRSMENVNSQAPWAHQQNLKSISETPCYEQEHQKQKSEPDIFMNSSVKLNFDILNDKYAKRIESVDANAWGDKDLKICIYQEWVDMLTKINESFIINMAELEREVEGRLNLVQKRANSNCRHSQGNELMKCRKDIDTLLKYIRNGRNCKDWSLQGLTFETIMPAQLLADFDGLAIEGNETEDSKNFHDADVMQKNKLYANMKALAHEVAEKHDEVRELKRQIICLEDEIQKAQKKIQLKDDVIKELRNDLKCANNKVCGSPSMESSSLVPAINFESQTSRSGHTQMTDTTPGFANDNGSQFDSLSHTEQIEQQKIKTLDETLSEYFQINENITKQQIEIQRNKLKETVEKLESEKADAYRKLDFIRCQLIHLESDSTHSNYDSDSGFHSKEQKDQDAKLLELVRERLRKLNESNCELKKKLQKLELEKNEISNNLHSEKYIAQRNSQILKEIADTLCIVNDKQFSYSEAYNANPNPFCEVIAEMQRNFKEREQKLLNAINSVCKQREELQKLLNNERDFNKEKANCMDIDDNILNTPITTHSSQSQAVTATTSIEFLQVATTLSTSLAGQQLDNTTAASLQGLSEK